VHAYAEAQGLPVRTPASLRDPAEQESFAALRVDAVVVVAYGLILPPSILGAPRLGAVNVHFSLLPRWRGAAPVQRAILAGDAETGVTIMAMDEGLDTGPILLQEAVAIAARETAPGLGRRLADLGARLLVQAVNDLASGRLVSRPQPAKGVTLAPKLRREEGRLGWRRPAVELDRQVRAFLPWPGAWFDTADGERIKVLAAEPAAGTGEPGSVIGPGLTVACGEGALRLARVQRSGRATMSDEDLLRGLPLPPGTRLPPS
jgi:methionyl-tRNA formyltransferase